jgi:hypothetical protein
MTITPPLALALLMTASAALAQKSPSLGTLGSGTYGIPFDVTAKDMTNPNPFGAFEGGQQDPLAKNDEFFKKCGTVPYRLCTASEQSQKDAWEAQNGKPKGDQAALEKRMAEQRQLTPDSQLLDMGDGQSFGIVMGDKISIDNGSSCGIPRPMTAAEKTKLAAQDAKDKEKQAAKAQEDKSTNGDKNGAVKINGGDNPINRDFGATSDPGGERKTGGEPGGNAPIDLSNSGKGSGDIPEDGGTPPSGNQDGKSLFAMNEGMRGGNSSGDTLGSLGSGTYGIPVAGAGKKGYIAMDGNKAVGSFAGFTWRQNADADANAKREAAALAAAWKANTSRLEDVPLNKGKPAGTQVEVNSGR